MSLSELNGNRNRTELLSVRLALLGGAALISLSLASSPAPAQNCMTNDVAERIQKLRLQLTKGPYLDLAPQPLSRQGLDYQLAQAQVDLASVQARAATSPSPEGTAQLKKAESRVKGLEGAVAKVRAELARLEALPACGARTIVPGAPPSRPPASPPSDRERNQSG